MVMVMHAAASSTADPSMDENVAGLFDSIFGLFEDLAGVGNDWGEPWGWLFPTFVAIAAALAFVGGMRYMFEKAQQKVRPVFFFALLAIGLLAFGAIQASSDRQAGSGVESGAGE